MQRPEEQASVATLAAEQARPHPPQALVLVPVSVSQPSSAAGNAGCTQLPQLTVHVELQTPAEQDMDWTKNDEHARPHPPQFAVLVPVLVSHPSSGDGAAGVEQFPKPATQVDMHNPELHDLVATFVLEHARPQEPQFARSVDVAASQPSEIAPD